MSPLDVDIFRFRARRRTLFTAEVKTINSSPDIRAANLDADIELWREDRSGWVLIQELEDPDSSLDAKIVHGPTHDDYRRYAIAAKSKGGYGDLGHYTVETKGSRVRSMAMMSIRPKDDPWRKAGPTIRF